MPASPPPQSVSTFRRPGGSSFGSRSRACVRRARPSCAWNAACCGAVWIPGGYNSSATNTEDEAYGVEMACRSSMGETVPVGGGRSLLSFGQESQHRCAAPQPSFHAMKSKFIFGIGVFLLLGGLLASELGLHLLTERFPIVSPSYRGWGEPDFYRLSREDSNAGHKWLVFLKLAGVVSLVGFTFVYLELRRGMVSTQPGPGGVEGEVTPAQLAANLNHTSDSQ